MIRPLALIFALLLAGQLASPLAAQVPMGLQVAWTRAPWASDPDDVPDVKVLAAANGFEVQTGPPPWSGIRPTPRPASTRCAAPSG